MGTSRGIIFHTRKVKNSNKLIFFMKTCILQSYNDELSSNLLEITMKFFPDNKPCLNYHSYTHEIDDSVFCTKTPDQVGPCDVIAFFSLSARKLFKAIDR